MRNGDGRSNAAPVLQIVLGAALAVAGAGAALGGHSWIEWLVTISGLLQIGFGTFAIRRNRRLDDRDAASRRQPSSATTHSSG